MVYKYYNYFSKTSMQLFPPRIRLVFIHETLNLDSMWILNQSFLGGLSLKL